jgi:hypothetical protein
MIFFTVLGIGVCGTVVFIGLLYGGFRLVDFFDDRKEDRKREKQRRTKEKMA